MAKKSKEGAAAHAIRTVEVPDCPAVRVKVMGGGTLPAGGTTGQVLTKKSDADGDAEWKDAGGGVFIDVEELPASDIDKDKFYRTSEDVYVYQQKVLDLSTTVWYGDGSHGFIQVLDEWQFIAFNVIGDIEGIYHFDAITAQDVNSLLDAGIIEVKSTLGESKIFGTPSFYGASELVAVEKGAYRLFHNPTALPGKYIEVGAAITVVQGTRTGSEFVATDATALKALLADDPNRVLKECVFRVAGTGTTFAPISIEGGNRSFVIRMLAYDAGTGELSPLALNVAL